MTTTNVTPASTQEFDFTVISTIIRSEKPNKPIGATLAANQRQKNRIVGYLPDGTKAIIE